IDGSLHAVNIRCKGRDNYALTSTSYQTVEGSWDITFRCRNTRDICIRRVTQHEVNALIAVTRKRWQVSWTAIQWSLIQLDVTSLDNLAFRRAQHDANRVRKVVDHSPLPYAVSTVFDMRLFDSFNVLRTFKVYFTLCSDTYNGKARS